MACKTTFGPTSFSVPGKPTRPWLQVSASALRCCYFHAVKEKHCSDEVTFVRQSLPKLLSSGKYIKLIYDWKSLSSIFWWPLRVTRRHKSLQSEHAVPTAVHFNLMLLISSPCAENYIPPMYKCLKQGSGLSIGSFHLNELLEGISTHVNTINLFWVYSQV